jgi:hypothetical protein
VLLLLLLWDLLLLDLLLLLLLLVRHHCWELDVQVCREPVVGLQRFQQLLVGRTA